MSLARPRSILRLILIGFAAVALPLIAAVITATVQVDRLAQTGRQAILDAEIATQQSRAIAENLNAMERSLGQYYVFADRDFYRTYLSKRNAFNAAAAKLGRLNLGAESRQRLQALLQAEGGVNTQLIEYSRRAAFVDPGLVPPAFAKLHEQAREILAESSRRIALEANKTKDDSARLQRTLLLQAAAFVPVALFLAGVFVVLINRPLKQIDNEIHRLGSGNFSGEVTVKGPQDIEELGRRLDWLRRRVLELEEQKTAFLRHISHELKTPLTSIREGAELLLDERTRDLNPEQKDIALIMRDSSQQLQRLIEDLLEFGKRQIPRVETRREPVALESLVRRALDSHSLGRTAKNLRFALDLEPVQVAGDEKQLRIVVDNLLSNAIKYTPVGGEIRVRLAAEDGCVTLEVADSGPGIDPTDRERVFEPFYQGKAPYVGPVQGTGLGLTIARQHVQAHDGSIEILDTKDPAASPEDSNKGARIRIRLPVDGGLQAQPAST